MSSFSMKAKHKNTGEVVRVWCLDDCFGKHEYGYSVNGGEPMREDDFAKEYTREEK